MPTNPLPNLTGTSVSAKYPFTRVVCCYTDVTTFQNGSEQRFVLQPPMYKFILPMDSLNNTDRTNYISLWNALKGRFTTNITVTLGSNTWSNLAVMSDDLNLTAAQPFQYQQEIQLRQVQSPASSYTPPSLASSFPTFSWGGVAQAPLVQASSFLTAVNEQEAGMRYAYAYYGASLTNFPTTYLRSWKISYPMLSDADLATLENYFLASQGRFASFSFTDPIDSAVFTHVRFAQDELPIRYISPNINQVEITLVETNNS